MDLNNIEIGIGDLWYIKGSFLGIESSPLQYYKVQIFMKKKDEYLVEVKHYETKKCNKVHLLVSEKVIKKEGIKLK